MVCHVLLCNDSRQGCRPHADRADCHRRASGAATLKVPGDSRATTVTLTVRNPKATADAPVGDRSIRGPGPDRPLEEHDAADRQQGAAEMQPARANSSALGGSLRWKPAPPPRSPEPRRSAHENSVCIVTSFAAVTIVLRGRHSRREASARSLPRSSDAA